MKMKLIFYIYRRYTCRSDYLREDNEEDTNFITKNILRGMKVKSIFQNFPTEDPVLSTDKNFANHKEKIKMKSVKNN